MLCSQFSRCEPLWELVPQLCNLFFTGTYHHFAYSVGKNYVCMCLLAKCSPLKLGSFYTRCLGPTHHFCHKLCELVLLKFDDMVLLPRPFQDILLTSEKLQFNTFDELVVFGV